MASHYPLREVKERNNLRLLGLWMKRFRRVFNKIHKERCQRAKGKWRILNKTRKLNKTYPICYKLLRQKHARDMNVKIMHEKTIKTKKVGSSSESITFDKCSSKTFTRKDNYWKHRERFHRLQNIDIEAIMEKEDNDCNICKKEFENKDLLIAHISLRACFSELDAQW